ncbi:MAG: rhodanese-like domain-containing protein, partial [Ruoffia tabacinasalis]
MQKLVYSSLNGQHLVDTRSQHSFRAGHIVGALNLNLANFKKYAINYFPTNEPMVFVTDDKSSQHLDDLQLSAKELGFTELSGYILFEEIPNSELRQSDTISANAFLNLEGDYTLLDVRYPSEITRIAPKNNLKSIPF